IVLKRSTARHKAVAAIDLGRGGAERTGITDADYNGTRRAAPLTPRLSETATALCFHARTGGSRIFSSPVGPGTRTKNPAGPAPRPEADFSGKQSPRDRPRAHRQPICPLGGVGKTNAVRILGRKLGRYPSGNDWKTSGRAGGISPGEARSSRASASPALPGFPRPPALWAGPFPSRKIRAGLVAGRRTGYRFGSVRSKVLRFVSEPSR